MVKIYMDGKNIYGWWKYIWMVKIYMDGMVCMVCIMGGAGCWCICIYVHMVNIDREAYGW